MRIALVVVLFVTACGGEPTLAGRLGPRTYGGLMFMRTEDGSPVARLFRLPGIGQQAVPVVPALADGMALSASEDGEWLAWMDGDAASVSVRRLRGTNEWRVTPARTVDGAPRLSADGRELILMRTRLDLPGGPFPLITIVDLETDQEHALSPSNGRGRDPVLSPDGQFIVWRSDTRSAGLELLTRGGSLIRVLRDGPSDGSDPYHPSFSPDGQRIVLAERIFGSSDQAITIINLDGEVVHTVSVPEVPIRPAWSPDGSQIAVCLRPWDSGTSEDRIVVWEPATGVQREVDNGGASACDPTWGR